MPDERSPIEYTQTQSPADEARSKDLSLQRTRPPTEIPEYQVQQFLGAGAYGEVWAGLDRNTGRKVAIKYYAHRRGVDWSLLSREVEKLVFLSADRYVVQLLEVGWDADPPYYVMEFIENGSLEDKLQRQGTFSPADATEMFREIGIGLVHAHGRGVLHCDLKPANVLIDQDGRPRLADFGQSRLSHEQKPALGTLFYMAPEQADMQAVPDARWDVYALGAIFYCLLIGRPPHRHDHSVSHIETATDLEDRLARYRQIIQEAPVPQEHRRIREVDSRLAEVIERCLAPNPDNRFANVQEVLDALVNRERSLARQKMMAIGLIGPLLVLIVAAAFSWQGYQGAVQDTEAGYRQRARENNEFAARLAAEKVTSEIGKYFIIVRSEALEGELHDKLEPLFAGPGHTETSQLMQKMQDPALRKNEDRRKELLAEFKANRAQSSLSEYLQRRLNIYLAAAKDDRHAPKFASVFVLDQWGNQLAVAFDNPSTEPTTLGLNVAHRSYFHGGTSDLNEGLNPREAGSVEHIRDTQLSAIFKSSSQKTWKVAVSTPIYRGPKQDEFAGVLVYTINVGDFAFFRSESEIAVNLHAVLVDGRPGPSRGSILQHPLFIDLAKAGQKPPEEIISMRVPDEVLDTQEDRLYVDPLGEHLLGKEKYGEPWIAAVASVRAPSVPGIAYNPSTEDTGLDVLVQSKYQSVVEPVRQLSQRLLRNIVLMLTVVVVAGIAVWVLALRAFREPRRSPKRPPEDGSTPLHFVSTLEAPPKP